MLSPGFKHRKRLALPVVKAATRLSRTVTVRQSYNDRTKWAVDTSTSGENEFDSFEDAMAFVREGGS